MSAVPPRYAAEVAAVRTRFADLVVVDGSLAAIARRLGFSVWLQGLDMPNATTEPETYWIDL